MVGGVRRTETGGGVGLGGGGEVTENRPERAVLPLKTFFHLGLPPNIPLGIPPHIPPRTPLRISENPPQTEQTRAVSKKKKNAVFVFVPGLFRSDFTHLALLRLHA